MSEATATPSTARTFEIWFREQYPQIGLAQADAVVRLASEGATLPFIARYRKEQTGNLDEVGIQTVLDANEEWESITKLQAKMLTEIDSQGKLTPELRARIAGTLSLPELEDLYLPYKPKRKSKASLAREAGLEPLADWVWGCGHGTESPQPGQTLELWAFTFRNEEKGIATAEAALQGASDILIERLSENADLRARVRSLVFERGQLRSQKGAKAKENSKYARYFDYHEALPSLQQPQNSHRYLAIRRGWMEEELVLSIVGSTDEAASLDFQQEMERAFQAVACTVADSPGAPVLAKAATTALRSHVLPAIEREAHRALKEAADQVAIRVFAENVRKLMLAAPFGPKAVLGVDPGMRTGCKLAIIDGSGKLLGHHVAKLLSDDDKAHSKTLFSELLKTGGIAAIAVGNGTGGREAEGFLRALIKELSLGVPVVLVNEAGASVYSASEVAREEFPELDVTVRGAISIARRLQDPLAELVKIDPKSIGVGQYQHDVAPHALKKSLDVVVDSCVNGVGVNLNTASYHLLARVSGIGDVLARNLVQFRGEKGLFRSRQALLEVPQFGAKAFEQAAGFLRIPESENPLDNTGVHPERYPILEATAQRIGKAVATLVGGGAKALASDQELATALGPFTFKDVLAELERPGRDPRETFVPFQYRDDVEKLEDLKPGMELPGLVTNVTNFGAFVDVGVHQDGLVHLSQLCDRFVADPHQVVSPGDRVKVRVISVDMEKRQIALSMKRPREERAPRPRGPRQPQAQGEGGEKAPPRQRREGPPRGPRPDGQHAKGGTRREHRPGPLPTRANQSNGGGGGGSGDSRQGRDRHAGGGRPHGGDRPSHGGGGGGGRRPDNARPLPKQRDLTHNPFAALAALKNQTPTDPAGKK